MSDEKPDKQKSFVGRNIGLILGAGAGALLPLILRANRNRRVVGNVERWIEKSGTLDADKQLLTQIRADYKKQMREETYVPDSQLVKEAWKIAEREGFDERPSKLTQAFYAVFGTSIGAALGSETDRSKSTTKEQLCDKLTQKSEGLAK